MRENGIRVNGGSEEGKKEQSLYACIHTSNSNTSFLSPFAVATYTYTYAYLGFANLKVSAVEPKASEEPMDLTRQV